MSASVKETLLKIIKAYAEVTGSSFGNRMKMNQEYRIDEEDTDEEEEDESMIDIDHAYNRLPFKTLPFNNEEEDEERKPLSQSRRDRFFRDSVVPFLPCLFFGFCVILSLTILKSRNKTSTYKIKSPPSNIEGVCSSLAITNAEGFNECKKLCSRAQCCIAPLNSEGSCLEDSQQQCVEYLHHCSPVFFSTDGIPDNDSTSLPGPPSNLAVLCDPIVINTDHGYTACKNACHPAQDCCTTSSIQPCRYEYPNYCNDYAPCEPLWFHLGFSKKDSTFAPLPAPSPVAPPPGNIVTVLPPTPPPAPVTAKEGEESLPVDILCAEENIGNSAGLDACLNECRKWACCWDAQNSCYASSVSTCIAHMICPDTRL